eukprot:CAMPEP_0202500644 /NCGR_PEP_ID=MMETSP1361-20130828/33750_1 /ASSEMBLY_ACC=CAM_ASM_000849 /TAXON_ID=210615 /ORGANISM="Staurosira complex sp., Strain CCMP2646" /LENGTH=442 /DNA_ID=CAMNT_0049133157 /DNA_START=46 /DNA_END=1371 /DNA_ORIENTATION=-
MTNASNEEEIMNEFSTPVGAGAQRNEDKRELFTPEMLEYYSHMRIDSADAPPPKSFRVGLLTINLNTVGRIVNAIANPASPCVVSALATLDPVDPSAVRDWVRSHKIGPEDREIVVESGEEGFRKIMAGSDVDAIYFSLPLERRNDFVTTALESGKHVLVHYPVSSSLPGFVSLFDKAHECGRHLQDSTTFIHHHRVTEFLGRVLGDQDSFPRIKRITANLNVRMSFLDTNVWKCNPDWPTQGCISTLARFCVMFGMLIFNRIEYKPKSAQVMKMKIDSSGLPIEATCVITFDPDCTLVIHCSYINTISVRQHVEVEAATRSASMINFVFPHHSLASYLLYEKTGKIITRGYSIDLAGGPPQDVMLWRSFAALSLATEVADAERGLGKEHVQCNMDECAVRESKELAQIEMQSFNIVLALMESLEQGCKEVALEPIEFERAW